MTDDFDAFNVDLEIPEGSRERDTNFIAQVESSLTSSDSDSESYKETDTTQTNHDNTIITPVLLAQGDTKPVFPPEPRPQVESKE